MCLAHLMSVKDTLPGWYDSLLGNKSKKNLKDGLSLNSHFGKTEITWLLNILEFMCGDWKLLHCEFLGEGSGFGFRCFSNLLCTSWVSIFYFSWLILPLVYTSYILEACPCHSFIIFLLIDYACYWFKKKKKKLILSMDMEK